MMDLAASALLLGAVAAGATASRVVGRGRVFRAARVEQAGASALLGRSVQHAAYAGMQPIGRALVHAGVTANAITIASVPLAAVAAVAFAGRHWGIGALFSGLSYTCDALDGLVARETGTASAAGEVLDAVCDRLCESLILGGIVVAWRASVPLLTLSLLAMLGAQQVTLATAKAETFPDVKGRVPRGLMRRAERAVYLVAAAAIAGLLEDLLPGSLAPAAQIPLVGALGLVALLGNASALHRFELLARALNGNATEQPRAAE
jgi:CDP-diacylglycerol--glycerol-3-phosphate 3-phosphatidyltransferase